MFYPEGLVDFASEKSFIPKLTFFLLHRCVQKWLFAKYCPHFSFITLLVLPSLEILFFQSWKKNSLLPLNQWQMMCSLLFWKEILILWALKLVRAHFHFYIIYKFNNKIYHIINCLDSSVDRAMGSDSQG